MPRSLQSQPVSELIGTFEISKEAVNSFHGPQLPLTWSMKVRMQALTSFVKAVDAFEISAASHSLFRFPAETSCKDGIWIKPKLDKAIPNPSSLGWDCFLQAHLNKLMHSLNGNTRIALDHNSLGLCARAILCLDELVPAPPLNHSSQACYSRSLLLSYRHSSNLQSPNPLITTPIQCTALSANPSKRTGRRVKFFSRAGEAIFHKKAKHKKFHGIKEFNNSTHRRSPPPRGAPGTPPRGYEECPNTPRWPRI